MGFPAIKYLISNRLRLVQPKTTFIIHQGGKTPGKLLFLKPHRENNVYVFFLDNHYGHIANEREMSHRQLQQTPKVFQSQYTSVVRKIRMPI